MYQEVQVTLSMQVTAKWSKEEIRKFILDMEHTYTSSVSARNRWEVPEITLISIKEEAELYAPSPSTTESTTTTNP